MGCYDQSMGADQIVHRWQLMSNQPLLAMPSNLLLASSRSYSPFLDSCISGIRRTSSNSAPATTTPSRQYHRFKLRQIRGGMGGTGGIAPRNRKKWKQTLLEGQGVSLEEYL